MTRAASPPPVRTILWRRLDRPGHEVARLHAHDAGWQLSGSAVFGDHDEPCDLDYVVVCDREWRTASAVVSGWIGKTSVRLELTIDAARRWRLDGAELPQVAGCLDVDLAFSPSTNLLPIRRLDLAVGQAAPVRAAWLRFPGLTVEPLDQVYTRIDPTTYRYESGGGAFTAMLRTNAAGLVISYPDLWEAVQSGPAAHTARRRSGAAPR